MATNFPTSLDALTNPTSSDSLSSPSHSAQHANVNDAVEALQAKVGVNGSAVTSSHDYKLANIGTWTAYTPTFTNLTVGNGTVAFVYTQINKLVHVNGTFTLGSTSSVGNNPIFTLPVARHTTANELIGTGLLGDSGTGNYMAMPFGTSTNIDCYLFRADHTVGSTVLEGGITATSPMTWTTNDFIYVNLTYRAA
jgi:hypothetical protein